MKFQGLKSMFRLGAIASLASWAVGSHAPVSAQWEPAPAPPTPVIVTPRAAIFEDVTLSPNFAPDPTTIRGISGGSITASSLTGRADTTTGPCAGFVDATPDHTMTLTGFFNYLSLQVQSPENTTLVVRGPGGSWCNDNYQSMNPGIAGQWLSGTYEIWVGSYDEDTYHPYVIHITETP